jgi:hypothetical protein
VLIVAINQVVQAVILTPVIDQRVHLASLIHLRDQIAVTNQDALIVDLTQRKELIAVIKQAAPAVILIPVIDLRVQLAGLIHLKYQIVVTDQGKLIAALTPVRD